MVRERKDKIENELRGRYYLEAEKTIIMVFSDQSSVRKITKKLKEIDVDEQLRKKRKILHR